MNRILLLALLVATPATAEDYRLRGDPLALSHQLSQIDNAYRHGCGISRHERREVWEAAENFASMTGMDWGRVKRNALSDRASGGDCAAARGIVRNSRLFNGAGE
jgi:hypothetical protein